MSLKVLFSALPVRWEEYQLPLTHAFHTAGLDVELGTAFAPEDVDYIVFAPNGPFTDFSAFVKLKAVLSLWAGVETIVRNSTIKVPVARMVDNGLTEGMTEWVTGHVLRHHLGMDQHIKSTTTDWQPEIPPLARDRTVGILGLGELGQASATTLANLNFNVLGWSNSKKSIPNVKTFHGADALPDVLRLSEILVLLLPFTPATANIMNAQAFTELPKGAFLINPGRGQLVDDQALLAALDSGHVAHATLDVFRTEPLPADHPYWSHNRVTVTPHIASETRPVTAAACIADNIRRAEAKKPMLHLVNREAGY